MDHLGVLLQGEGSAPRRLPDAMFTVIVLTAHTNSVRNEVGQTEPTAELSTHGLHESFGTSFGVRPEIVDELILCHPNARDLGRESRNRLVSNDVDEQIRLILDHCCISDGLVPDLVEGIGLRNQPAERDFPIGVVGVDDQAYRLNTVRQCCRKPLKR